MRAVGIHLGLNAVDPAHYMGWSGMLAACENDARDMAAIARSNLFEVIILLTREATSTRLLQLLAGEAARMGAGDILMLTVAGHGTRIPDVNGDEPERLDEAWLLYDRMLIDDEIYNALARFRLGVKILIVADSCHSGTIARRRGWGLPSYPERELPSVDAGIIASTHQTLYKRALLATPRTYRTDLKSSALLISACKDEQVALDGDHNGRFTGALKSIWAYGRFNGDYISLVKKVRQVMPSSQTPGLLGMGSQVAEFAARRPFSRS